MNEQDKTNTDSVETEDKDDLVIESADLLQGLTIRWRVRTLTGHLHNA